MSVVDQACAVGVHLRIKPEDKAHDFSPVGGLGCGVQQAQVGHEVALVIAGDDGAFRRAVVKGRCRHLKDRSEGRTFVGTPATA